MEAQHHVNGPDVERNSGRRGIKKLKPILSNKGIKFGGHKKCPQNLVVTKMFSKKFGRQNLILENHSIK